VETITCKGCKKPHPGPQKTCQKCRDRVSKRRQTLKKLGLCTVCKQEMSVPGKASCRGCLDFAARQCTNKRKDRRAEGLCEQCGKATKVRICGGCRQKVRANQRRELRRRTSEEVCRYCRKDAVVPDRTGCRACLDERADYSRKRLGSEEARKGAYRKRDERYAKRKSAGLCIFCDKPAAPFVKCETHRALGHARYHLNQIKKRAAEARQALRAKQA
jgi:hypothetical protein